MNTAAFGDGIVGHSTILRLLSTWVDAPAPGYLFVGPAHLGKRTIAERFVQQLLDQPQNTLNTAHPDLIILTPEEGKNIVSVEAVRAARARLSESPMVARRLVTYIPQCRRLNEEGMNALLKVLEEPPAGAVFVLVAEDLSHLPATILSRLVKVPFFPVSLQEMSAAFGERAASLRGRPGLASAEQTSSDGRAERFIHAKTVGERLMLIEALAKDCESSDNTLDAWSATLADWSETCRRTLAHEPQAAIVLGQGLVTATRWIGGPLSPRLPLESAAVRLSSTLA